MCTAAGTDRDLDTVLNGCCDGELVCGNRALDECGTTARTREVCFLHGYNRLRRVPYNEYRIGSDGDWMVNH